ncbi:hypothetical protein CF319_g7680 [Tilletia indica]|uniref:Uncharacterized protein n=1 Tax=Tilletia indica TaxID=43049 RepID=A0A177T512_9BASI|nr:hypothetical protein CF319_g7680 [Tilletia indica]KAE8242695.1 hypothetical protein A4X13_0g7054 [Tilletia indica]
MTSNYMQFVFTEEEAPDFSSNEFTSDAAKHGLPTESDTRNTRPRFTRSTAEPPDPAVRFDLPGVGVPNSQPPTQTFPSYTTPTGTPFTPQAPSGHVPTTTMANEQDGSDEEDEDTTFKPPKPFRRLRISKVKRLTDPEKSPIPFSPYKSPSHGRLSSDYQGTSRGTWWNSFEGKRSRSPLPARQSHGHPLTPLGSPISSTRALLNKPSRLPPRPDLQLRMPPIKAITSP